MMMERKIRLSETDATGVIYFTELLKFATEAFEAFLEGKVYKIPIVSAKATYETPLCWSDQIEIELKLTKLGNRSFTLCTEIKKEGVRAGTTEITHVVLGEAIPSELRECLERLQ